MQDREFQEFRTTRVTGGGYKGIPNGLNSNSLGLVSCACLHCTLYGVAYVKPGQVCDSVDASCHKGLHAYVMFVLLNTVPTNRTPLRRA